MPVGAGQKPRGVLKKSAPLVKSNTSKKKDVKDVRQRSRDWILCWRSTERRTAVMQALDAIFKLAANEDNFQKFGNDVIQCFYDISSVTHDPVRSRALMYVEQLAQRWRHSVLARGWRGDLIKPPASTILDTIVGLYCMERIGVASANLKKDLTAVLARVTTQNYDQSDQNEYYQAIDYFGWNPISGPPPEEGCIDPASGIKVSRYRALCTSLTYAFYIDSVGLDIGCAYHCILEHLQCVRPYLSPRKFDTWEEYVDQCYLTTHVVFTLSNWGELSLESHLLPHEYLFIREHLPIAVRQNDVHLVGEYMECLRVFGVSDADPIIKLGISFLLNTQSETTHCWDDDLDAYTTYHATMVAAQGLLAHNSRGFGPGLLTAVPVLEAHLSDISQKEENVNVFGLSPDERVATAVQTIIQVRQQAEQNAKAAPVNGSAANDLVVEPALASENTHDLSDENERRKKRQRTDSPLTIDLSTLTILKSQLEQAAASNDWTAATSALTALDAAAVNVDVLRDTGLGIAVNQFKKAEDVQVAALAKALVKKWRSLVKEYNGSDGTAATNSLTNPPPPPSSSRDPSSNTPDAPSPASALVTMPIPPPGE